MTRPSPTCPSLTCLALSAFAVLASAVPPMAQTAPAQVQAENPVPTTGECPPPAGMAEPATPESASADGTAPANSGSTGWSGGTGGSLIGTNPQGATRHTKTWHAPTARGLDLTGRPEPAPAC
ncbi:hypothetical protein [Paracoccus ravus]|uniref:hypothetical protein n=1 Tax=Paracoccus ravus TaxID=2447760 RepID=UPI00106DEF61|nr:hypothetical protein [Paracoccus ravus]